MIKPITYTEKEETKYYTAHWINNGTGYSGKISKETYDKIMPLIGKMDKERYDKEIRKIC